VTVTQCKDVTEQHELKPARVMCECDVLRGPEHISYFRVTHLFLCSCLKYYDHANLRGYVRQYSDVSLCGAVFTYMVI